MSLDKNRKIHIVDTTLRDGSHAVSHSYTVEQVTAIASGLDKVGVDIIELSHGDGLAGSSINYGFSATPEMELIRAASQVVRRARLGVLLLPGVGTIEDLKEARANGAQVVRVATHVTEADIAIQHLKAARELGMMPVGFLMMAHMAPPEKILEQAQIFVDAGAEYVNIADSAGYMTPDDVRARISLLVEKLPIPVGFHAHNNLGLAVANALTAAECGADYIDVTCRGRGGGRGIPAAGLLDRPGLLQLYGSGGKRGGAYHAAAADHQERAAHAGLCGRVFQLSAAYLPCRRKISPESPGHFGGAGQTRHGRRPGGHDYRRGPCPLSGKNRVLNLSKGQWQNRIEKGETSI